MPVAAGMYYFAHEADDLSRPPVILIHGAGGHHLFWSAQLRRMPNQRIFAIDLPGHGKSEGIGFHTIDDYTWEIIAFIKALRLNAAVLAGHSMGGAIALNAAIRFPRHVLGLCLIGCGPRLRVAPAILQGVSDPSTFEAAIRMIMDNSFSPHTDPGLKEAAAQRLSETRPSVLYGDFQACDAYNVSDLLSKIEIPTFILSGAYDKMVPLKSSEFLRDNIAGARMEVLSDAGHMLIQEQPVQTADKLSGFLDSIPYHPGQ
jgi:pimeloyl-ACP methyl ester carboxylesterase